MPSVSNKELKALVKESVKEALEEELIKVHLMFLPEAVASDRSTSAFNHTNTLSTWLRAINEVVSVTIHLPIKLE